MNTNSNLSNIAFQSLLRTIRNYRETSRPFSAITTYNEFFDRMSQEQREQTYEVLTGELK